MSAIQPSRNNQPDPKKQRSNRLVAAICLAFFGGMVGMAYAAVPLYAMFCQVTGYGGTTQRVEQYSDRVLDREITVRFDANVSSGLPWDFKPVQRDIDDEDRRDGAERTTPRPTSSTRRRPAAPPSTSRRRWPAPTSTRSNASASPTPRLKPGETLDMPVVFYVDPDIVDVPELKDIKTITLSYTFFPIEEDKPVAAAPTGRRQVDATNTDDNLGG